MGEAFALIQLPVTHVYRALPAYNGPAVGNNHAPDEVIAQWCGRAAHVLVTTDDDFRSRWVRSHLLETHGVEVIVFDREIKGLIEQHRRVTLHVPEWQERLEPHPYAHRVWVQHQRKMSQVQGQRAPVGSREIARTR